MYLTPYFAYPPTFTANDKKSSLLHELLERDDFFDFDSTKYNMEKINDTEYSIEINATGLSAEDINIEIKDNVLTVSGEANEKNKYKFTTKRFSKSWKFADPIEANAELSAGILILQVNLLTPEEKKPKRIEVKEVKKMLT